MYEYFKKKYPDSDVTYSMFKHVVSEFNKKASAEILDGKVLKMDHGLGNIFIAKIPRTYTTKDFKTGKKIPTRTIDWVETRKLQREEGITKLIYYTDDFYCKWYWTKFSCVLPNKTAYKFIPTRGKGSNTKKLAKLLQTDEFAHTNFIEVCYNKPHQYENFSQRLSETLGSA